jgi:hypothetical protein
MFKWWEQTEYADVIGDTQASASLDETGSDVQGVDTAVAAMQSTPLGEPPADFDVRCVYDSRILNGYDFNYTGSFPLAIAGASTSSFNATFKVPYGYRLVPREWEVIFDMTPSSPVAGNVVYLQANGADIPNNGPIIVGFGTTVPIKSFYVCEEGTTFGITGTVQSLIAANVNINVYGNLIPVTDVALPFSVANQLKRSACP